jgi:hypothetical protein
VSRSTQPELDALIAEATVDCYNESECVTGFYTMLVDNLAVPFQSEVLGVEVTVTGVDLTEEGQITVVCMHGAATQRIPILDLPLPTPPPEGVQWIEVYRRWAKDDM